MAVSASRVNGCCGIRQRQVQVGGRFCCQEAVASRESSSRLTLFVMLVATLIFLPVVLIYTTIVFRALRGTITADMVEKNSAHLY